MEIEKAYNLWASQYDSGINKTRDLEAIAFRACLENIQFRTCLEIGCGTGKNTKWLIEKVEKLTAVDFSEKMLAQARQKISSEKVNFQQADVTQKWHFASTLYELISCSLVLEHIENLHQVFKEASKNVIFNGYLYVGELHPFKQYSGSKARFNTAEGEQVLTCFTHHLSDYLEAAKSNGFRLLEVKEHFDNNDRKSLPRILTLLFQKH
ncbi:class I SAM-dependent DNA methyltransferase [Salinimicrobium sp. GXAS 041]|uniref:class I SAM-dependent DNA methyltransferase n=1 Tax=Salinimicrobium sp. GXAS 041 TaxID=3400806 RepID=UPI003C77B45F